MNSALCWVASFPDPFSGAEARRHQKALTDASGCHPCNPEPRCLTDLATGTHTVVIPFALFLPIRDRLLLGLLGSFSASEREHGTHTTLARSVLVHSYHKQEELQFIVLVT